MSRFTWVFWVAAGLISLGPFVFADWGYLSHLHVVVWVFDLLWWLIPVAVGIAIGSLRFMLSCTGDLSLQKRWKSAFSALCWAIPIGGVVAWIMAYVQVNFVSRFEGGPNGLAHDGMIQMFVLIVGILQTSVPAFIFGTGLGQRTQTLNRGPAEE